MSIERKANYILEQAKVLAANANSWTEFSTAMFDQHDGLVAKSFTTPIEKEAFFDSEQYREVNKILLGLIKRFGVKDTTSEKSGRFVVRVPKTVHAKLVVEAKREGVSLNQLAVSKLSVPLRESMDVATPLIVQAYSNVYKGYSTDRVVVDPELNVQFLAECRRLGLNQSDYNLNHALLDIRKSGKATLPAATERTQFNDYDEYQFASEIAIRILQRTEAVTLDQVLCDPCFAMEFDRIAKQLAPRQPVLKLRWAALNLRKTRRLGPLKKAQKVPEFDLVTAGPLKNLSIIEVPEFPATYVLYDVNRPIFAGETEDLRRRIDLHLKSGLPGWLGVDEGFDFLLKRSSVPAAKQEERKLWLQAFVNRERPLLNFQRAA